MRNIQPIQAEKLFNYQARFANLRLSEIFVGPNDDVILYLNNTEAYPRLLQTHDHRNSYKICHYQNGTLGDIELSEVPLGNFAVQPLSGKSYLIAPLQQAPTDSATVINHRGDIVQRLFFGHDTQNVQITETDKIWVGFGDEAFMRSEQHVGLAVFDASGEMLHSYTKDWCDGLNVVSDSVVWYQNYNGLTKIVDADIDTTFETNIGPRSRYFAVTEDTVMFQSSRATSPPYLTILELGGGSAAKDFYPVDSKGERIPIRQSAARGSKFFFVDSTSLYVLDLKSISSI